MGVLTADRSLTVRSWDAWLARVTGHEEHRALGCSLLELFPEIEARGMVPRLRRVLDDGTVEVLAPAFHQYLIECASPDAAPHFTAMQQHVTMSPLRDAGVIAGIVITIEDVTARCVQERELAAQLKSQNEEIRLRAARALSAQSPDPAPLLDVLGDDSWQVRRTAATGVAAHADEQVIERLVNAIEHAHTDIGLLNAALKAIDLSKVDAVPPLLRLLERADANVRMYGALALGNLKDQRAAPALIRLLDDADLNVRYHAIEALGRIRSIEAVAPLAAIVEARDPFLAFASLDALAAIGESSAAPAAAAVLDDVMLAAAAVDALGVLGSEQDAAALAHMLKAEHVSVGSVCRALGNIAQRLDEQYGEGQLVADVARAELTVEAGARLIKGVRNASDDDLPHVARVLGWLDFAGVEFALAGLLQHPTARAAAQEALIRRGSRATSVLVQELAHAEAEVRRAAAVALGRVGDPHAVAHLVRVLEDPESDVIIGAVQALGSIGDHSALLPLLGLLGYPEAAVRAAAVSAINSIGHPDTAVHVAPLLHAAEAVVRECAVRVAGYFGYIELLDDVIALVDDEAESVRRAAAEHLGFFDDQRVKAVLLTVLTDSGPSVRAAAARALAHIPRADARGLVRRALADPDPRVRYQAVLAAANQHLDEAAPLLADLLQNDAAVPVRIAAAQALGTLGHADVADTLAQAAEHEETDLACAAIAALARIPGAGVVAVLRRVLLSGDVRRQLTALDALAPHLLTPLIPEVRSLAGTSAQPAVVRAALATLARAGTTESIDAVFTLATAPSHREDAIAALSRLDEAQVPWVARGLRHPDARVRTVAVDALARMKQTTASRALAFSLNDEDPRVKFATMQALGRLDWMERPMPAGQRTPRSRADRKPS